jgi:hypothetical protein
MKFMTFYIAVLCCREFKTAESDLFYCNTHLPPLFRFLFLSTCVMPIIDWMPLAIPLVAIATLGYSSRGQGRITAVGAPMHALFAIPHVLSPSPFSVPSIRRPCAFPTTLLSFILPFLSSPPLPMFGVCPQEHFFKTKMQIFAFYCIFEC